MWPHLPGLYWAAWGAAGCVFALGGAHALCRPLSPDDLTGGGLAATDRPRRHADAPCKGQHGPAPAGFGRALLLTLVAVLATMAGARVHAALGAPDDLVTALRAGPSSALEFWSRSGQRIAGGLLLGGGTLVLLGPRLLRPARSAPALLDAIVPWSGVAMAVGRLGCLAVGCCFGTATDRVPGLTFPSGSPAFWNHVAQGLVSDSTAASVPVHALSLYLGAAGLLAAGGAVVTARRLPIAGSATLAFAGLFSTLRLVIEPWRETAFVATPAQQQGIDLTIATLALSTLAVLAFRNRKGPPRIRPAPRPTFSCVSEPECEGAHHARPERPSISVAEQSVLDPGRLVEPRHAEGLDAPRGIARRERRQLTQALENAPGQRGREHAHRIVPRQLTQIGLCLREIARAVGLHDRAQTTVARPNVVGEQSEEEIPVHLLAIGSESGRGEKCVVPLIDGIETTRPQSLESGLARALRHGRDLEQTLPAVAARPGVKARLGRGHAHHQLWIDRKGARRLGDGRREDAGAFEDHALLRAVHATVSGIDLVADDPDLRGALAGEQLARPQGRLLGRLPPHNGDDRADHCEVRQNPRPTAQPAPERIDREHEGHRDEHGRDQREHEQYRSELIAETAHDREHGGAGTNRQQQDLQNTQYRTPGKSAARRAATPRSSAAPPSAGTNPGSSSRVRPGSLLFRHSPPFVAERPARQRRGAAQGRRPPAAP